MEKLLITGAAGFIGFHVSARFLEAGHEVVGLDNLNEYYDVRLKQARLEQLMTRENFRFVWLDVADRDGMARLFAEERFATVVHLAAQAGVLYSLENPQSYIDSNLVGFGNILEGCRQHGVKHLVFASSSSIYGANTQMPFSEHQPTAHPISLYAASKKANELMAHAYAHMFKLPCTGLRFFTVYGPWGRPDMAMFKFAKAILAEEPIQLYNHGKSRRDFTYVDDVAEGVFRIASRIPVPDETWNGDSPDPAISEAPYRIYNIGNHQPVELFRLVEIIEECLGKTAVKELVPLPPGDVPATFADVADLMQDVGFQPATPIETGVRRFIDWYRSYYSQ